MRTKSYTYPLVYWIIELVSLRFFFFLKPSARNIPKVIFFFSFLQLQEKKAQKAKTYENKK